MTRPPRTDRTSVADHTIGVRVPPLLFAGLVTLVDARNEWLRAQGVGTRETPASYVRSLIEREVTTKLGPLDEKPRAATKAIARKNTPSSRFTRIRGDAVKVSPAKKGAR